MNLIYNNKCLRNGYLISLWPMSWLFSSLINCNFTVIILANCIENTEANGFLNGNKTITWIRQGVWLTVRLLLTQIHTTQWGHTPAAKSWNNTNGMHLLAGGFKLPHRRWSVSKLSHMVPMSQKSYFYMQVLHWDSRWASRQTFCHLCFDFKKKKALLFCSTLKHHSA